MRNPVHAGPPRILDSLQGNQAGRSDWGDRRPRSRAFPPGLTGAVTLQLEEVLLGLPLFVGTDHVAEQPAPARGLGHPVELPGEIRRKRYGHRNAPSIHGNALHVHDELIHRGRTRADGKEGTEGTARAPLAFGRLGT